MRSVAALATVTAALAASLAGGCLFVDTINQAPTATLQPLYPEKDVLRNGEVAVRAVVTDADGDERNMRLVWSAEACNGDRTVCRMLPDVVDPSRDHRRLVPEYVPQTTVLVERVIISLDVEDARGAPAPPAEPLLVVVGNAKPTLEAIQSQWRAIGTTFPVDVPIEILVTKDDVDGPCAQVTATPSVYHDGLPDPLVVTERPPRPSDGPCVERFGLRPMETGEWTVKFALVDGLRETNEVSKILNIIDDTHPCIESLSPGFAGPVVVDAPRRFSVLTVSDDKDEYPAAIDGPLALGVATFRWSLATASGAWIAVGGDESADFVLDPARFAPGDRLSVRVDVDDRVSRPACRDADDRCEQLRGDALCSRRMTWDIEVR